jgi:YaiO family outer membrane protein
MRPLAATVAVIGVLAPAIGLAADGDSNGEAAVSHQTTLSVRAEQPDRGLDGWRALRMEFGSLPGNWQRSWQAAAVAEERFGDSDRGIELGGSLPLDDRWMLQAEAGVAPGAEFLPRRFTDLRLMRRFEGGTLATIGWRGARYRERRADRALVSLEQYAGNWRLAWTGSLVRVDGRHAPGHELAVDRYYGDRDHFGVRLSRGRELAPLPDGMRVFARVRSAALVGRHWMRPRWGLQWSMGYVAQAGLYDRSWIQLGLQHAW